LGQRCWPSTGMTPFSRSSPDNKCFLTKGNIMIDVITILFFWSNVTPHVSERSDDNVQVLVRLIF
jgi:hypothetical protein